MLEKQYIKIYGDRNSGTRYLERLIKKNLNVKILPGVVPKFVRIITKRLKKRNKIRAAYHKFSYYRNLGWKHTIVKSPQELEKYRICLKNIVFLTISKNPYSWLLSLHRRPYTPNGSFYRNLDFENFLSERFYTLEYENIINMKYNPIELWNMKNNSYLELSKSFQTINFKHEEVLANPEKTINLIQNLTRCSKTDNFRNVIQSTKGDSKDFSWYQDYYLEEKWRNELSFKSIKIINKYLDDFILSRIGYRKIVVHE